MTDAISIPSVSVTYAQDGRSMRAYQKRGEVTPDQITIACASRFCYVLQP